MPVREFTDSQGREWRAWEVAPDDLNARIKDEDYLAALNYTGWIAFETKTETEKRRLYPIPKGWYELPDRELEALLAKAEVVPARKLHTERFKDEGGA
jgi:ABC-type Fe3+ transport system substrate-binding protein